VPVRDLVLNLREKKSGRALLDAANDLDRAAAGVDKLGGKSKATTKDLALLRAEIEKITERTTDLKLQFARTGDRSLFGDLRKQEADLKRIRRVLADLSPERKGGGLSIAEALFPTAGRLGRIGSAAIPVIAELGPTIGSAVATAVLGGIGVGGMVGGIALAADDPRVKSAFKDLGHEVGADLNLAAAGFSQPLVEAADTFAQAWRRVQPGIRDTLDALAETVEPASRGFANLAESSLPGVEKSMKASALLADEWAQDSDQLGDSVSDMFASFAAGAPGARAFFKDAITFTGKSLVGFGELAELAAKIYASPVGRPPLLSMFDAFDEIRDKLFLGQTPIAKWGEQGAVKDLTDDFGHLKTELHDTSGEADLAEEKFRTLARAVTDNKRSAIGYAQALADLRESVKENGPSIDLNTEKGRDNARAFLDAAQAARDSRDAMIKMGVDSGTANALLAQDMAKIEAQAGKNKAAVHALIEELAKVPPVTRAQLLLEFSRTGLPGEHSGQRIADLAPKTPLRVGTISHQAFLDLPTRDAGGPVMPGQSYLIGGRPEILTMGSMGGHVTPIGSQITLRAAPSGNALIDALIGMLSAEVQHRGGSPTVLGITR
jgi:hypothetical protein